MLTLRRKFFLVGSATVILTLVGSGSGLWGARTLLAQMDRSVVTGTALRNQVEADMMHDALRSDVLAAIVATETGATGQRQEIERELAKHVQTFRDRLAQNAALPLPAAVRQAQAKLEKPLAAYMASAERTVAIAFEDRTQAVAALPGFHESFSAVE